MNKFAVWGKRLFLFVAVNFLVMTTISLVFNLLKVDRYVSQANLINTAIFCLIFGFTGSLISLALSRVMAKWTMGVQVIPPDTNEPELRDLVATVHELARRAQLPKMPEVGIYQSPELNAFATGPTRSRALVAVSTGLLQGMGRREVIGVLGHEVSHIANGDMVTLTLIQGIVNAFALFLSRILAGVISSAMRSRDDRDSGGGGGMYYMLVWVLDMVFMLFGMMVVAVFSRWREFHADAGSARLAGRDSMIDALRALQRHHEPQAVANDSYAAFKINGRTRGLTALFATHPPIEERIDRLQQLR